MIINTTSTHSLCHYTGMWIKSMASALQHSPPQFQLGNVSTWAMKSENGKKINCVNPGRPYTTKKKATKRRDSRREGKRRDRGAPIGKGLGQIWWGFNMRVSPKIWFPINSLIPDACNYTTTRATTITFSRWHSTLCSHLTQDNLRVLVPICLDYLRSYTSGSEQKSTYI